MGGKRTRTWARRWATSQTPSRTSTVWRKRPVTSRQRQVSELTLHAIRLSNLNQAHLSHANTTTTPCLVTQPGSSTVGIPSQLRNQALNSSYTTKNGPTVTMYGSMVRNTTWPISIHIFKGQSSSRTQSGFEMNFDFWKAFSGNSGQIRLEVHWHQHRHPLELSFYLNLEVIGEALFQLGIGSNQGIGIELGELDGIFHLKGIRMGLLQHVIGME